MPRADGRPVAAHHRQPRRAGGHGHRAEVPLGRAQGSVRDPAPVARFSRCSPPVRRAEGLIPGRNSGIASTVPSSDLGIVDLAPTLGRHFSMGLGVPRKMMSVVGIGDAVCRESTFWIPAYAGMTFMRGSSPPPSGAGSPRPPSSSPRPLRHPASPSSSPRPPSSSPRPPSSIPASPFVIPASPLVIPASPLVIPASPLVIPASPFVIPASPFVIPASPFVIPASPRHPRVPLRHPAASPFVIPASPFVIPAQAGIQKDPGRDTPGIPLLQPSYCESGHASPAVDRPNAVVACINRPAKNAGRAPHAEPLQSSMPAGRACGWASMPVPLPGQTKPASIPRPPIGAPWFALADSCQKTYAKQAVPDADAPSRPACFTRVNQLSGVIGGRP